MNHKSRESIRISALLAVVVLSLGLLWLFNPDKEITAGELQQQLDSLNRCENPNDLDSIRKEAYELATRLFDDPARCDEFTEELIEMYAQTQNKDFLLVYNAGGLGGGTMADDPEWPSVLNGIQQELRDLGYDSLIVEHQRAEGGIAGLAGEMEQIPHYYSVKAPELAAKIAFLTSYNPHLRVIITGRSNGAAFCNEVITLLETNPQVYSIQAGRSSWYIGPVSERTLLIDHNGIMPDAMSRGDFLAIIRANLVRLPTTYPPEEGSMKIFKWYIKVPGHAYIWDHPGVQSQIAAFLEDNFGS